MSTRQKLLQHPFWEESDPTRMCLVRFSREFPAELNPFARQGVVIRAAGVPGDAPHSKWIMAREGIKDGIKNGYIEPNVKVVEATSGNTGNGMGIICNILGIPFVAIMSGDAPQDKINAIRTLGRGTSLQLLFDSEESTVACARRLGAQNGWYNPCQYDNDWNPRAHWKFLAPQLWEESRNNVSLLFVPGGTMGTSIGLKMFALERNVRVTVVPVLCAEGQEVPGARSLSSIREDVKQPWWDIFREDELEFGSRHAAFYLSFLTWSHVPQMLGPSFGLAFTGALKFLRKHRNSGSLDQFRGSDGKVHVVIFGPDDYKPYMALYMGVLNRKTELSVKTIPNLMHVID